MSKRDLELPLPGSKRSGKRSQKRPARRRAATTTIKPEGKGKRGRRSFDFYPTPRWAVRSLLENISGLSFSGRWLEPGVGDGAIVRAVDELAHENGTAIEWTTNDIREEVEATHHLDFTVERNALEIACPNVVGGPWFFDVSIQNPEYKRAEEHVRAAIGVSNVTIALLRVGFLQAEERAEFMRETRPAMFVVPHRISFDGIGNDPHSHAWFVWGIPELAGTYEVLPTVPLAVRRAEAAAARERLRMIDLERHGQRRLELVHSR